MDSIHALSEDTAASLGQSTGSFGSDGNRAKTSCLTFLQPCEKSVTMSETCESGIDQFGLLHGNSWDILRDGECD